MISINELIKIVKIFHDFRVINILHPFLFCFLFYVWCVATMQLK